MAIADSNSSFLEFFSVSRETATSTEASPATGQILPSDKSELKGDATLIQEYIRGKAIEAGLNPETMLAIAKAESRFRNVSNFKYTDESGHYTAFGIFQITRTTFKSFCGNPDERMDIQKNIDCAMKIAKESGLHHWSESEYNWK